MTSQLPFAVAVDNDISYQAYKELLMRHADIPMPSDRPPHVYAEIACKIEEKAREVFKQKMFDDAFILFFRCMTMIEQRVWPHKNTLDSAPGSQISKRRLNEVFDAVLTQTNLLLEDSYLPALYKQHMAEVARTKEHRERILAQQRRTMESEPASPSHKNAVIPPVRGGGGGSPAPPDGGVPACGGESSSAHHTAGETSREEQEYEERRQRLMQKPSAALFGGPSPSVPPPPPAPTFVGGPSSAAATTAAAPAANAVSAMDDEQRRRFVAERDAHHASALLAGLAAATTTTTTAAPRGNGAGVAASALPAAAAGGKPGFNIVSSPAEPSTGRNAPAAPIAAAAGPSSTVATSSPYTVAPQPAVGRVNPTPVSPACSAQGNNSPAATGSPLPAVRPPPPSAPTATTAAASAAPTPVGGARPATLAYDRTPPRPVQQQPPPTQPTPPTPQQPPAQQQSQQPARAGAPNRMVSLPGWSAAVIAARTSLWRFPTNPSVKRRGLVNLGNTCYINSTLQSLASTCLGAYFQRDDYIASIADRYTGGGKIANTFTFVMRELALPPHHGSVSASNLKRWVAGVNPMFDNFSQQDASEFLKALIAGLHEDLNSKKGARGSGKQFDTVIRSDELIAKDFLAADEELNASPVLDRIRFQERSMITCTRCSESSRTFQVCQALELPIPNFGRPISVEDCFAAYIKEDSLRGAERYSCATCRAKTDAQKQTTLFSLAPLLMVTLKRFAVFDASAAVAKNSTEVAVQPELDVAPFMSGPTHGQSTRYRLVAIVNHQGSLGGGHYTADVRNPADGTWSYCSDEDVRPSSTPSFSKAYMLFYQRTHGERV